MKKIIISSVTVLIILFALACNSTTPKTDSKNDQQVELASVYYTCPMHPEIHSDEPGQCPICGMDLVKSDTVKADSTIVN